ncbi:hypothetical protein [Spartinivicinus marinus]|uniref:hypothetical protein n=1 Tax=Spartinivicinus marinus TaxID=2994442 RepID=UPI0022574BC5|nr:hypothetical protein [Spartinivicinus marinus]MCX4030386.1 hypothetical protein [Spartinivicinus marinus]
MSKNKLNKVTCTFNIFENGRSYSGKERGYVLDNFKKIIDSPETQERLKLREMVGYVGHGIRELTNKLFPGETDVAKLDSGKEIVIKAIPACVCTELNIDDEGNVTHSQEILDNEEGKTLLGLHNSKVGGFSIAARGSETGANTFLNQISGFDYVINPNFANNRGYVLDSTAEEKPNFAAILDAIKQTGVNEEDAENRLQQWFDSVELSYNQNQMYFHELVKLQALYDHLNQEQTTLVNDNDTLKQTIEKEAQQRQSLFAEFAKNSPVVITDAVANALVNPSTVEDLEPLKALLDNATKIDGKQLPLKRSKRSQEPPSPTPSFLVSDPMEYGAIETAPEVSMY